MTQILMIQIQNPMVLPSCDNAQENKIDPLEII